MKRPAALIIAVFIFVFVLASCSNNKQNGDIVSTMPSSIPSSSETVSLQPADDEAADGDYLNWTYSDWSSASNEEQQACIEEYAIMLLERSGLPSEMDDEQMSEISGYLTATVEMKLMMDKEATLEDILNDTLASLEE